MATTRDHAKICTSTSMHSNKPQLVALGYRDEVAVLNMETTDAFL